MNLGLTLVISFLILPWAEAITFKSHLAETGKRIEAPATEILQKILSCIEQGKKIEDKKVCAKPYFSKELMADERNNLLSWLAWPLVMSYPTPCSREKIEHIREEYKKAGTQLLCADYKLEVHNKTAIFFMILENGHYKLRNVRR